MPANATTNPVGRPLKFDDPVEFDARINAYFEQAEFPTITGLAVFLDTSRETLREYKLRPEFVDSIKKALDKCQAALEERTLTGRANPVMAIFTLKNNYGWADKTEVAATNTHVELDAGELPEGAKKDLIDGYVAELKRSAAQS